MIKACALHLKKVNESYWQHMNNALSYGFPMIASGFAVIVHAFVPAAFENTASETVRKLYAILQERLARAGIDYDITSQSPVHCGQRARALAERYYDAFNRGDRSAMLECVDETIAHDVNQGGRRVGKKLFAEFCEHMDKCYAEHLTDMVIMVSADGKRVAAEFTVNGEYKSTDEGLPPAAGQKYCLPAGAFLDIANGKITRVTTYYNLQDWIAQVSGE